MRYLKHLIIFGFMLAMCTGCSSSRRAFSKGEKFEAEGRYEDAMFSYADAFRDAPDKSEFRVRFLKARDAAADFRFKKGNALYDQGQYVAALAEYQTALGLDPTQGRFKQQVDLTSRLKDALLAYQEGLDFERNNKLKDAQRDFARAVELHPGNKEYMVALARVSGARKSKLEGYELNLKSAKPITLKFKDAKLKDVFNILSQLSGINFIFDEAVKDQQVSIFLENATFQQAFDLLTNMYKLGRKIANESTVIIYPKTPDKTKQYEDMQLRTFHLNYMDAKKAVNLIRTMIQVRKIYVNEDANSIVVRDTNDIVEVVERILDANDVPEPEVILDVEVIEVTDSNSQRLGLLLSDYSVKLGAFSPSNPPQLLSSNSLASTTTTLNTGATTATTSQVGIDNLIRAFTMQGYGGFVTVPNAQYNFGKALSKGEVLSNPKIRVKNKEKSKFTVGTRLPITTSNTTNATVSVNVQYVDVGVKVNAEPTIQLNNEIVIKLSLEVSAPDGAPRDVGGGTSVVTINTRNLETVMSLKDGETSIIGGLIQHTTGDSKNKFILLSDIPLIGNLFSDSNYSNTKNELMLAITPRLVRGVTVPQGNLMSFSSGKEDDPSIIKPFASFEETAADQGATAGSQGAEKRPASAIEPGTEVAPGPAMQKPGPAVQPGPDNQPVGAQTAPVVKPGAGVQQPRQEQPNPNPAFPGTQTPGRVKPDGSTSLPVQPVTPTPAVKKPAIAVPPPAPQRGLLQISAPTSATLGQQFKLDIKVTDVKELALAPLVMTYDPIFVEYVSSSEGDFLRKDSKPTTFSSTADPASGVVNINLTRGAGSGGVSGAGTLFSVLFRAKNQGAAGFGFRNVSFTAANGSPVTMLPFATAVDIR
ncbi:MAG TPA: cohesin domain-containing protein [Desulfuromonadaceae bacterium]|jgi:general secretion pathway protein D